MSVRHPGSLAIHSARIVLELKRGRPFGTAQQLRDLFFAPSTSTGKENIIAVQCMSECIAIGAAVYSGGRAHGKVSQAIFSSLQGIEGH